MPPRQAKQNTAVLDYAIPTQTALPANTVEETTTPEQSPRKQTTTGITQAQKQALVDNLQLEITERARKLRAQYALQAQALRSRLEMRVNRIPQVLRKRKMQDLLDEHAEMNDPKPAPAVVVEEKQQQEDVVPDERPRKSLKRPSEHITTEDDKENAPTPSQDLANPKKRAKPSYTANTKATRTASRKIVPSTVLSPKSHNSRTLPRSPFKSPEKAHYAKPSMTHIAAQAPRAATRTASRQTRKAPASMPEESEGRSSEASTTSAGTTIVSKQATRAAGAKVTKGMAAARKPVPVRKENVAPAPTGRSLRKRA